MVLHKPVSLADQIFDRLETDILTEKYPKGTILTEIGLSEELGVSRTPVREALSRLEQEHIIENAGKGMRVIGISEEDIQVVYEIREKIEGMAASACAKNCT
ncbi:MAG: GntR family transcriptional regulator, partial [Lachnospiraceae bacterium]|nr:GntR family transcriptional regulator [Lachnospiraceae bacterium]